ncbi:hypothetical protein [Desulforhabdus sp. TSK]|uniref:hypothetical protein n=1 Tax=Desulforhabdus sp. TSK TaxID=2925014 RepID=UPI001FC8AC59|nr:hypothetical protein [Desulforhabdus sp. TSK]
MQQRILMACASEVHGCPFSAACSHACPMCSFPHEDCIETSPFSREKEIPSALRENGAHRYALCLRQFLSVLHRVNGFHGQVHRLDRDGFYLGRRVYGNRRVGFVFLRRVDEREVLKLAGLRYLCREDEFLVLLNPSFTIENLFTRHLLHQQNMVQKPLAQCLDPETLEIPLEEMVSEFLQLEKSEIPRSEPLSKAQASDYQRLEFLCHDRLHFPGTLPTKRSNLVQLNDNALRLGDALFVLLLYLAVELKKGEGGWADKLTLWEKGLVSSPDSYQAYSNLRNTLTGITGGQQTCQNGRLESRPSR